MSLMLKLFSLKNWLTQKHDKLFIKQLFGSRLLLLISMLVLKHFTNLKDNLLSNFSLTFLILIYQVSKLFLEKQTSVLIKFSHVEMLRKYSLTNSSNKSKLNIYKTTHNKLKLLFRIKDRKKFSILDTYEIKMLVMISRKIKLMVLVRLLIKQIQKYTELITEIFTLIELKKGFKILFIIFFLKFNFRFLRNLI